MKLNKVLSTILSVAVLSSSLATVAHAQEYDLRTELDNVEKRIDNIQQERTDAILKLAAVKKYSEQIGYHIYVDNQDDLLTGEILASFVGLAVSAAEGPLRKQDRLNLDREFLRYNNDLKNAVIDGTREYLRNISSSVLKEVVAKLIRNRRNFITELRASAVSLETPGKGSTAFTAQMILKETKLIATLENSLTETPASMRAAIGEALSKNLFAGARELGEIHSPLKKYQGMHIGEVEKDQGLTVVESLRDFIRAKSMGNKILLGTAIAVAITVVDILHTSDAEKLFADLLDKKSIQTITDENNKKLRDADISLQTSYDHMQELVVILETKKEI